MWELMFGVLAPISKIDPSTYKANSLPWFDLYSETPATNQAGHFQNVQSLAEVDCIVTRALNKTLIQLAAKKTPPSHELLDPLHPPLCSKCPNQLAACVLRPCTHTACAECLFAMKEGTSRCRICRLVVRNYVGFASPVETRRVKELAAIAREKEIVGVTVDQIGDKTASTVMLDEDRVNSLHGARVA